MVSLITGRKGSGKTKRLIEQVNKVLFENKSPKEAVSELMLRDKKIENSQLPWE